MMGQALYQIATDLGTIIFPPGRFGQQALKLLTFERRHFLASISFGSKTIARNSANSPNPRMLALEITEDLEAALAQVDSLASRSLALSGLTIYVAASQRAPFAEIAADLKR